MKDKIWSPIIGAIIAASGVTANAATCSDPINGVVPSSGQCYKGHFNQDGKLDILVQAQNPSGTHAIYLADKTNGTYITAAHQTWTDNYLGLNWSASEVSLVVEDYNHDQRADVRVDPLTGTAGSAIVYSSDAKISNVTAAKNFLFIQDFEAAALTDISGLQEPAASDKVLNDIRKLFPGVLNQSGPQNATTFTAGSVLSRLSVSSEIGYTGNRVFRQKYPAYVTKLGELYRSPDAKIKVDGSGAQFYTVLKDVVNGSTATDRQVYMAYDLKFNATDYGITLGSPLSATAGPGSQIVLAGPVGVFDPTAYEKITTLSEQKSFPTGNPRDHEVDTTSGNPIKDSSNGYIIFKEVYNRGWAGEVIINNEVIRYRSRSGNKLIIDKRGVRGTVAANHNTAAKVKLGFDFMRGFKMPGFRGGTDRGWMGNECTRNPTANNPNPLYNPSNPSATCDFKMVEGQKIFQYGKNFIARLTAAADYTTTPDTSGYPAVYTYSKDRYEYGELMDLAGTAAEFKQDAWHRVEYMLKLNTVTSGTANRNGQIKVWLDGKLVYDRNNFAFYDDPALIINWFHFNSHFGGVGDDTKTQKVELRDADNFIISNTPIWGAYTP